MTQSESCGLAVGSRSEGSVFEPRSKLMEVVSKIAGAWLTFLMLQMIDKTSCAKLL